MKTLRRGLPVAFEKQQFEREDLIYRLSTFPILMLRDIPYHGSAFDPQKTEALIHTMVQDIESERDNSIASDRAPAL